ncbi:MAG TPA: prolipoprotein diacylglyceryl transferase family protein [Polyangiales bacterium]|nr:prolipoprotein diacylglyceryl transferase family protein [Polyangiales bacterium]
MHPILFNIPAPWGPQPIYAYGVLLGLALLVGWQMTLLLGRQAGLGAALLSDVYLLAAVAGVAGARILYVVVNHGEFSSAWQWFDLRNGGLAAYGGFVTGFAAAAIYLRAKRVSLLNVGDCAAPAIAVGLFLTRIGCYLYGCDFGTRLPASAPEWLTALGRFPHWPDSTGLRGSPAFALHVDSYGLAHEAAFSYPVHPTQLYEAGVGLVLMTLCLLLFPRRRFWGQVLLFLCMSYGSARFFLEYLRDDPERGFALGFSTTQLMSLIMVPVAAVMYSLLRKPAPLSGRVTR